MKDSRKEKGRQLGAALHYGTFHCNMIKSVIASGKTLNCCKMLFESSVVKKGLKKGEEG